MQDRYPGYIAAHALLSLRSGRAKRPAAMSTPPSDMKHLLVLLALLVGGNAAAASPTVLNVIGDTGDCELAGTAQVAAAMRRQPDFRDVVLVEVGDLAYPVATRERLLACHEPHFSTFPKRLAVPGNHDWADSNAAGFFSIFPRPVPRVEDLGGPWKLVLLDSNLRGDAGEAQLRWLDGVLAESRDACLIAAWHHPRWSSGRHGNLMAVDPLWQRVVGHVSLTLHGHDHHFEALPRFDAGGNPNAAGTASFVVGTGGARPYLPGLGRHPGQAIYGRHGYLRLTLDGDAYRWRFVGVDDREYAAGEGRCRRTGGRPYAPPAPPQALSAS